MVHNQVSMEFLDACDIIQTLQLISYKRLAFTCFKNSYSVLWKITWCELGKNIFKVSCTVGTSFAKWMHWCCL